MKEASKTLFVVTIAFAIIWSTIHFVRSKGLPPTWVHELERGLEALHINSSSEFTKPRADLSVLIGSQRKQQEALNSLSNEVKELEIRAIETENQLRIAQHNQDATMVAKMMETQALTQQEEIRRYKDLVDELNKEKREEASKKTKPMPIIITSLLGLAALYVLLSKKYEAEATKWALGTLGIVAGFWLGGA